MATQPAPFIVERTADGHAEVGDSGGEIRGLLRLNGEAATGSANLYITVTQRPRGSFSDAFQSQIATGQDVGAPSSHWVTWQRHAVRRDACEPQLHCEIPFVVHLRPIAPARPPLVVAWHIEVQLVYQRSRPQSTPSVELIITSPGAPPMPLLAMIGAIGGALAGALVVVFTGHVADRRRRAAIRDVAGALMLLGMGVVLAQGVFAQSMPSAPAALWLLVGSATFAYAVSTREGGPLPGYLLGLAVMGMPLMLFVHHAAFRAGDVLASVGVLVAVGVIGAASLDWRRAAPVGELGGRSTLSFLLTSGLIVLIGAWAVVVASGLTDYPALFAILPALTLGLLVWALWRWLTGRGGLLLASGILLIPLAVLGFVGAVAPINGLFSDDPVDAAPAAILSVLLIGASGPLLIASGPPRRDDGTVWLG